MAQLSSDQIKSFVVMTAIVVVCGGLILLTPWVPVVAAVFVAISVLMMLVILIQKPKGGGLSGAFGGAGGSAQAAFGAKTGDLLTGITVVLFLLFLTSGVKMTLAVGQEVAASRVQIQSDDPHAGHDHGPLDTTSPQAPEPAPTAEPAATPEPAAATAEPTDAAPADPVE